MQAPSPNLVQEKFAQYYKIRADNIIAPSLIQRREFGLILLKEKIMLRHRSFESLESLKSFLMSATPADVYYSAAYYDRPGAEMEGKGWVGADLIFDIDADHIPTPCGKVHDSWFCSKCGFIGKGPSPEKCPACGEAKFDSKTWVCEDCLESAKRETIKLLDMLMNDFGFASNEVKVFFSGHRGYHVHVENKNIRLLDSMARKEIVDYVIGLGLKSNLHRIIEGDRIAVGRGLEGWRGRIIEGLHGFLEEATSDEVATIGLSKKAFENLLKNKEMLKKEGWLAAKGMSVRNWEKIVQWIVSRQSSKIDTVVTTDIHRLIRLAGTLHGKTGFMKAEAPLIGLDKFDPLKEAVAFKEGEIVVDIVEAPKFRVGDITYGPYRNAKQQELPTAAALFLLCKGAAQVVNSDV